jgi:hypothetical protein
MANYTEERLKKGLVLLDRFVKVDPIVETARDMTWEVLELRSILRECLLVIEGIERAEGYLAEHYLSVSAIAEMAAHYNGYSGSPDKDILKKHIEQAFRRIPDSEGEN